MDAKEQLALKLFDIQAVKFGEFTLKSGIQSPVYFDFRGVVSHPKLLREISNLLWEAIKDANFDSICGVPYTALPFATCISIDQNIPMLVKRKETKDYGTKKMVEGSFELNDKCLIIEDVVTSGASVLETVSTLTGLGIQVKDAVVLLDREQGGSKVLEKNGVNLRRIYGVSTLISILKKHNKIDEETVTKVTNFVKANDFTLGTATVLKTQDVSKFYSYKERQHLVTHPMAKRVLQIMEAKKTNLAFSADVTDSEKLLSLADEVGPYICVLKTHIDILNDFNENVIIKLKSIAKMHNFIIFEDRKFADIGNTVLHQYTSGVYKISSWADMINAHSVPGEGVVKGLKNGKTNDNQGCLLIAQMSSAGALTTESYKNETVNMAKNNSDFVFGFISTEKVCNDPKFLHFTPGVKLNSAGDDLGQQYNTPDDVIVKRKSDIIIVGRGIYQHESPASAAKLYRDKGHSAYEMTISSTAKELLDV